VIIAIRDKGDVELSIKGMESPEPVESLLNETREEFTNMIH
jgi:hypothetical protein